MNTGEFLKRLDGRLKEDSAVGLNCVVRLIIDGAHYTINFQKKWLRDGDVVGFEPNVIIKTSTLTTLLSPAVSTAVFTSDPGGEAVVNWLRSVLPS